MEEMMNQINAQMMMTPQWVQYWMNWMGVIFMASVLFVWKHKPARYVLLSFPLTMIVGMLVFHFTKTVHLLGIAHLLVWMPLFKYLFRSEIKRKGFSFISVYGIWVVLVMATIAVSLVFDVRDIYLVMMGLK